MISKGTLLAIWLIASAIFSTTSLGTDIDDYIKREMLDRQVPGAAYAVIDRGKVHMRPYGIANLETGTKVQTDAVFEAASVIKPFTAIAVMQLVETGKITLDEPIKKYIDNTPAAWAGITARHLLSHTSGLPVSSIVTGDGSPLFEISIRQQFNSIAAAPLLFPPGEGTSYSDDGFFLLGMIIEKASGQKYRDYMREHIFAPAGMTSTRIEDRLEIVKNHVSEYILINGRLTNHGRTWHELPSYYGLWTTIGDMVKWDRALDEGLLLRPETLKSMWLPSHLKNGSLAIVDGYPYGLGWFVPTIAGHRIVGHVGYFGSVVFKFPDDKFTVIFFGNLATTAGSYQVTMAAKITASARPDLAPLVAPLLGSPSSKADQPK